MNKLRRLPASIFILGSVLFSLVSHQTRLDAAPTGLDARNWRGTLRSLVQPQVSLCGGRCTCSYADRIINGQPYTNGQQGFGFCSTSCGSNSCNFRPGVDGCGAILYLGCTDLNCRISTPPVSTLVPVHTSVIIPPITSPPVPTLAPTPIYIPPVQSVCTAPLEWVELEQPRIARVFYLPPYPVLQSQVTSRETVPEVTFSVEVRGGRALLKAKQQETVCPGGGTYPDDCPNSGVRRCRIWTKATYQDQVVQVQAAVQLTGKSRSWIEGDLSSRYLGAHVRQPSHTMAWTGSTMSSLLALPTWDPLDPGHHMAQITATTLGTPISNPQTVFHTHLVEVSLLDTTLAP